MDILQIIFVGISLSMDAFAVAMCKGIETKKISKRVILALSFGVFQGLMPLIGYFLGIQIEDQIKAFDHWIVFVLLLIIGSKMIVDAFKKNSENASDVTFKEIILLSIATSIDALAVGVSFAFLEVKIYFASMVIFSITFILSLLGTFIGSKFGEKYKNNALFVGGVVLIIIGVKILIEHLFF